MSAGVLLILCAAALAGYNTWEDRAAGAASDRVLGQVRAQIPSGVERPAVQAQGEGTAAAEPLVAVKAGGRSYLGILEIPALDLTLPILSKWSYPNLKAAPCRYRGSAAGGDFIIAGHNYESHFGQLKTLETGAAVLFTDADGAVYAYEVSEVEVLDGSAVTEMSAGDWDLTLFTCTVGGAQRVTVRCGLIG
ncbi:MAG TPA: sortase [Pseudoflavonifractor sp.]|nr:sortase [Pseudoflavonifractor sp.]